MKKRSFYRFTAKWVLSARVRPFTDGELYLCRYNRRGLLIFGRASDRYVIYTVVNMDAEPVSFYSSNEARVLVDAGDVKERSDGGIELPQLAGAVIKTSYGSPIWCTSTT